MNKQNIFLSLGIGAMAISLAALPGNSTKLQNPDNSAAEPLNAKLGELQARAQQVVRRVVQQQNEGDILQEVERVETPEVDDIQVLIGEGSWLGVETNEVTAEKVKELKLPAERGVLVGKIVADSPASKAGLKENDVITELNGQRVEGTAQFRRMIREVPAGRAAQLTVQRDGKPQSVSVTLGNLESRHSRGMVRTPSQGSFAFRMPEVQELPEIAELGDMNSFVFSDMAQPRLGIDAEDLQGELGTYFGAPEGEGVLVRSVHSDSPAAKAGIKAGDVITSVNGKRVRHVRDLREELKGSTEGKSMKIGLLRNKSELTLDAQIPARAKKEIHQRGERTNL